MIMTTCTMHMALIVGCIWQPAPARVVSASFYHEGPRVATGERYDNNGPTAAHRTLPFGSRVLVRHAGRSMVVLINDCGPAKWTGREIDLSLGAARRLAFEKKGIGNVEMAILSIPHGAKHRTNCVFARRPGNR